MNIRRCLNGHFYDAEQHRVCPVCGARYSEPANVDRPARPVAEPPAAAPETVDGRYEVLREIGRGGMSVVYLVSDRRGKKPLALKKIRCFSPENAGIVYESILMESALMQRISSPYFPAIHDIVHNENEIYIVMDYVEGVTLQRMVEQAGRLEPSAALHIATELCKALQYLHTLTPPIIVRDVKPSNIMIQPDKGVKLIDFGIAKELKTGASSDTTALGTRGYASPEHFGGLTDQRSDIYSFGETVRFALTGRDPNKTAFDAEPLDLQDDPLAVGFDYIIEKCTRVDPDDRYQNCGELLYDLEHIDKLSKRRVRKRKRLFGSRKKPSENAALAPDMPVPPPPKVVTSQLWTENTVILSPAGGQTEGLQPPPGVSAAMPGVPAPPYTPAPPVSGLELLDDIEGSYIFVSYAHRDGEKALRIIRLLQQQGVKVWYDNGIRAGSEWRAELEAKIKNCGYFVSLISANYFKSKNCTRELGYAADKLDNVLMIYLEKLSLPEGFEMFHTAIQAIYQYSYRDDEFLARFFRTKGLNRSFFKENNDFPGAADLPVDEEDAPDPRARQVFVAYDVNDYVKYGRRLIRLLEDADVNVWHKLESCTDLKEYQTAAAAEFGACDGFVFFLSETLLNDGAERGLLAEALEKASPKACVIGILTSGSPEIYAEFCQKMTVLSSDSVKVVNAAAEMILGSAE